MQFMPRRVGQASAVPAICASGTTKDAAPANLPACHESQSWIICAGQLDVTAVIWLRSRALPQVTKQELKMSYWLVIDLEATTEEGGWPVAEMEIIEIGASLVNQDGREIDHFERFVRPVRRPLLTPFCRELTHIQQSFIDSASTLPAVWPQFERWIAQHRERLVAWTSWGDYDRQQLQQDWRQHQLTSELATLPHINLKQRFAKARHLQKPCGLNTALQLAGMHFNGPQHRALSDARNTARLLPLVMPG